MFELTVIVLEGRWVLLDDVEGEIGAFSSRAEALEAAGGFTAVDDEPRHVLVRDGPGQWDEVVVEPRACH